MGLFPMEEIQRKAFHQLILIYVLAYWFLPRPFVIWGFGLIIAITIIGEFVRLSNPAFNSWLLNFLKGAYRKEESDKISGLLWTLSGSFLTILLFSNQKIVLTSLFYLAFGDASAAIFGKVFGKHNIITGKTFEGSLACFIVCLIVGLFFLDWKLAIVGAFVTTLIEILPWPLNDNFWMPLISATMLTLLI